MRLEAHARMPAPPGSAILRRYVLPALIACCGLASAAPPAGHPDPGVAGDVLGVPGDVPDAGLARSGIVLRALDSNAYTYIEVLAGPDRHWLAAPRTALVPGQVIRYAEGTMMRDFYSRKLGITFPTIMFVRRILVVGQSS